MDQYALVRSVAGYTTGTTDATGFITGTFRAVGVQQVTSAPKIRFLKLSTPPFLCAERFCTSRVLFNVVQGSKLINFTSCTCIWGWQLQKNPTLIHPKRFIIRIYVAMCYWHKFINPPTTGECEGGQVWNECGSACTFTCSSPPGTCFSIAVCVPRCECPTEYPILHKNTCIAEESCKFLDSLPSTVTTVGLVRSML